MWVKGSVGIHIWVAGLNFRMRLWKLYEHSRNIRKAVTAGYPEFQYSVIKEAIEQNRVSKVYVKRLGRSFMSKLTDYH